MTPFLSLFPQKAPPLVPFLTPTQILCTEILNKFSVFLSLTGSKLSPLVSLILVKPSPSLPLNLILRLQRVQKSYSLGTHFPLKFLLHSPFLLESQVLLLQLVFKLPELLPLSLSKFSKLRISIASSFQSLILLVQILACQNWD